MKISQLLIFIFFAQFTFGQNAFKNKIDSSNYYDYFANGNSQGTITTARLSKAEATPIILDELEKAGFKWLSDNSLYKLPSGQYIVLTAYCRKSNFGFLYAEGFPMMPTKATRGKNLDQLYKNALYTQVEYGPNDEANFVSLKTLPSNILMLAQNSYWYQYSDNQKDNDSLVTKDVAIKILRQDIQKLIEGIPKPK